MNEVNKKQKQSRKTWAL